MPTRCNRGFYCRSYCLVNMFRAPLCPSSGAQEYYTVVAACGICCSILQTGHITFSSTPDQQLENHSTKYHRQQPLYNTLELLMMGIVVPETCGARNKICNKDFCCIQLAFYFHMSELLSMQTRLVSCSGSFRAGKTVSVTNWTADSHREKLFPQPLTETLSRPSRGKSLYYSVTSTQKI